MERLILEQFDNEPWGILKPEYVIDKPKQSFPEVVVCEFSEAMIQVIVEKYKGKKNSPPN